MCGAYKKNRLQIRMPAALNRADKDLVQSRGNESQSQLRKGGIDNRKIIFRSHISGRQKPQQARQIHLQAHHKTADATQLLRNLFARLLLQSSCQVSVASAKHRENRI